MVHGTEPRDAANAFHARRDRPGRSTEIRRLVRRKCDQSELDQQARNNGSILRHECTIKKNRFGNPVPESMGGSSIAVRASRNGYVLTDIPEKYMHMIPLLIDFLEERKRLRRRSINILMGTISDQLVSMVEMKRSICDKKKMASLFEALQMKPM